MSGARFLSPLRGLLFFPRCYPRLAPWALFFRRFAAGLAPRLLDGYAPGIVVGGDGRERRQGAGSGRDRVLGQGRGLEIGDE